MQELIQNSLGSFQQFKIEKDRVIIKKKNINNYEEYYVKFDSLGLDLTRKQTKSVFWLIPFWIIMTGLGVYLIFDEYSKGVRMPELLKWIGIAIFFMSFSILSFFQKVDKVYLQGGSTVLELYGSNPDKQTVDNFIKELHNSIREFYKRKYAILDPTLSEEMQVHNYKWLKEINAINNTEYDELLNNLRIKNLLS